MATESPLCVRDWGVGEIYTTFLNFLTGYLHSNIRFHIKSHIFYYLLKIWTIWWHIINSQLEPSYSCSLQMRQTLCCLPPCWTRPFYYLGWVLSSSCPFWAMWAFKFWFRALNLIGYLSQSQEAHKRSRNAHNGHEEPLTIKMARQCRKRELEGASEII